MTELLSQVDPITCTESGRILPFEAAFSQIGTEICHDGLWRCQDGQDRKIDPETDLIYRCRDDDNSWMLDERMNSYEQCTEEEALHIHDHATALMMNCNDRGFGLVKECNVGSVAMNWHDFLFYRCSGTTLQWIQHEQAGDCDVEDDTRMSPDGFPQVCVYQGSVLTWKCDQDAGKQTDENGVRYMCTTGSGLWKIDQIDQPMETCEDLAAYDDTVIYVDHNDEDLEIKFNTINGDNTWRCDSPINVSVYSYVDEQYYRCVSPGIWILDN